MDCFCILIIIVCIVVWNRGLFIYFLIVFFIFICFVWELGFFCWLVCLDVDVFCCVVVCVFCCIENFLLLDVVWDGVCCWGELCLCCGVVWIFGFIFFFLVGFVFFEFGCGIWLLWMDWGIYEIVSIIIIVYKVKVI